MPDNAFYYHAAYAIAVVVYGAYIVSLVIRSRKLRSRSEADGGVGLRDGRGGR